MKRLIALAVGLAALLVVAVPIVLIVLPLVMPPEPKTGATIPAEPTPRAKSDSVMEPPAPQPPPTPGAVGRPAQSRLAYPPDPRCEKPKIVSVPWESELRRIFDTLFTASLTSSRT